MWRHVFEIQDVVHVKPLIGLRGEGYLGLAQSCGAKSQKQAYIPQPIKGTIDNTKTFTLSMLIVTNAIIIIPTNW